MLVLKKLKSYSEILLFLFIFIVPLLLQNTYILHIMILFLMWSIIGMSWNLLGGFTGQVSFGHAAFFGIGAYSAGLIYLYLGISSWWGFVIGIPILVFFSIILGFIVLRLRGPFFALATLASGEVLRITVENLHDFTRGDEGIMLTKRTWVEKDNYFLIIFLIFIFVFYFIKFIMRTKLGYYFLAIREDQDAAESMGIPTTLYKTISFTISGVFTGIAGAFYMNYMGYIDPKVVFALHDISIVTIMVVMVGGVATYWGPIIGSIIMIIFSELIRNLNIPGIEAAHQTLFGILLILIIIFLPNGIVGDYKKLSILLPSNSKK